MQIDLYFSDTDYQVQVQCWF